MIFLHFDVWCHLGHPETSETFTKRIFESRRIEYWSHLYIYSGLNMSFDAIFRLSFKLVTLYRAYGGRQKEMKIVTRV